MYTIYADGELLYTTSGTDDAHIILSPKCSPDVNGAGSLSFVMPPGHALYDDIRKLKSIITLDHDGNVIFRGRAIEVGKDIYGQKNVYCEGDRSFLMDSQCAPYTYSGTALGLLEQRISDHNSQVEHDKQFTLGTVTAIAEEETLEVESTAYTETWKEIEGKLLSVYGGYMVTRTEGDTTYLDWLKQSGPENSQPIQFSVNLLDLKDKIDAANVFTILIPLGASTMGEDGEYSPPVDITTVNDGLNYIQDDDAVALYGKIWRTKTWSHEEDPQNLLERGREHLNAGIAVQTLTLQAIDMHFVDDEMPSIRVGDHVHIISSPHGLDLWLGCVQVDIDLLNPENTTYTFGEPPRILTENVVKADDDIGKLSGRGGGGGRSVKEELSDILRWAKINVDEANANINLNAGEIDTLEGRVSTAEIDIDGVEASIVLKASQTSVDEMGERVSAAELEIDGLNSTITLKADKIDLQGYVTASKLETEFTNFESGISESLYVASLSAGSFSTSSMSCGSNGFGTKQVTVLTSGTSLTVNASGGVVTGVTLNKKTDTLYYWSWE